MRIPRLPKCITFRQIADHRTSHSSAPRLRNALQFVVVATMLIGCAGDPIGPEATVSTTVLQNLQFDAGDGESAIDNILIGSFTSTQTSPWYVGWSSTDVDSLGNVVQFVGVRPSTAVPVKSMITYLNGSLRERRTLLWEPAVGGWELVRVASTFYNEDGSLYASSTMTPDELGLTSFLSSTCTASFTSSMTGCFSGTLQTVGGFVMIVAAAPFVPVASVPSAGLAAAGWVASWVVWTGVLIDTVEACSTSGAGGSATQRPTKRLT